MKNVTDHTISNEDHSMIVPVKFIKNIGWVNMGILRSSHRQFYIVAETCPTFVFQYSIINKDVNLTKTPKQYNGTLSCS